LSFASISNVQRALSPFSGFSILFLDFCFLPATTRQKKKKKNHKILWLWQVVADQKSYGDLFIKFNKQI
jgi:hypothetical protein